MKYIKHLSYITVIVLIVMVMALSCAKPAPAPSPAEPVKIGVIAGLTGSMAVDVVDCVRGIELRLDEVGWQVVGRKIELIKEDYASDPANAVDKARKLVDHDKVDIVLGPLLTPAAVATAGYLTESRTPHMVWMPKDIKILQFGGGNGYMPQGTCQGSGYPMGLYAYDELGYRTATAIQPDFSGGEMFVGSLIRGFESRGGTVIQRQRVPMDAMDFAPYLTVMKEADCCFWWNRGPFVGPFLKQYHSYGLKMPFVYAMTGPAPERALAEAGDIALGMVGASPYTPLIDTEINKKFADAFYNKYEVYARGESMSGHMSVTMFLEAVKATGGDTSHDKINQALHKLKVDTPGGVYSFTPEGLGIGDMYIQKVIKIGDRYCWEPIYAYSQIVLDEPK